MARVDTVINLGAQVPGDLYARLKAVADADERSVSYEVRQAVEAHVERLEVERGLIPEPVGDAS